MLDGLIGGLPRQGTVAIVGGPSSGATTLTLRAVAEAQATGAIAAWLDLPGRFDPLEAAERGVDLRWLVVVRPARSADGLRIVGALLASRSIDLLVLDLPPRMPTSQAGLIRQLAAQARRVGGRVLAIGSGSLTPVIRDALAETSHLRLALAHRDWLRVGREVVGQRVLVTVEKDRAGAPGRATEIEIRYQPDGDRGAAVGRLLDAARGDRATGTGGHPPTGQGRRTAASRPPPPYRARSSTDTHRCVISISTGTICRSGSRPGRRSLPSGPVVLGGQPWEPGSVLDASPAALRMGVPRGQPLGSAHALVPEAAFLDAHPDRYREVLEAALEALLAVTPAVEGPVEPTDPAFGRILLGIEGLERLWGDEAAIARRAMTTVGAFLPGIPRAGVGNTRFGSSVAASMEASIPGGDAHVEAAWLAPQPIGHLPADADTHGRFRRFGLTRIGDLAALPRSAVVARFGAHGGTLHDLAQGLDARPLRPRRPVERLRAQLELESPIDGTEPLRFILHNLCAGLCAQLVARGAAVTAATLTLTLEDATRSRSRGGPAHAGTRRATGAHRAAAAGPAGAADAGRTHRPRGAGARWAGTRRRPAAHPVRAAGRPCRPVRMGARRARHPVPGPAVANVGERPGGAPDGRACPLGPGVVVSPRYHRLPAIDVMPDDRGWPARVHWRGRDLAVEVCGQWRIDEPWGQPIARDYFQLRTLDPALLVLVFHDRLADTWHLERLYD